VYCSGKQEQFTAQAGWKERELTLATKWYPVGPGAHSRDELLKQIDISLKELDTDSVDIYYLHAGELFGKPI
jgi:aflatoxin B1 aldehyde reductase